MSMKKILLLGISLGLLLLSCKDDRQVNTGHDTLSTPESRSDISPMPHRANHIRGKINVYMAEESLEGFSISDHGILSMNSVPSPMKATLAALRATHVERLFPPAGIYEKRTREAGLHRWFTVTFDENTSSEDACQMMSALSEVNYAEPVFKMTLPETMPIPVDFSGVHPLRAENEGVFDDPMLEHQWHYKNTGRARFAEAGADINLPPAWKIETGSPKVIVSIVDGGIDTDHEDLKDNIFINQTELNGAPNVDDDKNGFVDDIYGYNFVTDSAKIEPDDYSHGTHVAGTVGARNNNSIGVCGIAGGDGSDGTGVRLMSCQIFRYGREQGNAEAAIKYGADNGAVISQNSWGYSYPTSGVALRSLRDAIDYFIKYAGCDENGNQKPDAPMKGGVVFFAAGNDGRDFVAVPASYHKVVSVSAMSPNFSKASYTNRGDWVTIMAPGGDQSRYGVGAGVLSTLSPKVAATGGNRYGYMQSTSMACPHVSGIAALMVSHFGGPGYTNEQQLKQLKGAFKDVDINEKNPGFEGRLGLGYIDAHGALTNKNLNKAPDAPIVDMERSSKSEITKIQLFWTIPTDEDDKKPSRINLFMSKEPLTASNYQQKGKAIGKGSSDYISTAGRVVGEEMTVSLDNLTPETTYYFCLIAIDRWGLKSSPVIFDIKTKPNTPPQATDIPELPIRLNLSLSQSRKFDFTVQDPDGHSWRMEKPAYVKGVTVTQRGEKISISIFPVLPEGNHEFTLVFVDELGWKNEVTIPFEIYKIRPPKVIMPITPKTLGIRQGATSIDLTKVFEGDKEVTLRFTATSTDATVASVKVEGDKLILTGHKPGETHISVTATDDIDNTVMTRFGAFTVADKDELVYSVYPIPTRTELNAWLNEEVKTATFVLTTMRGEEVFRKEVKPNEEGIGTINIKKFVPGAYTLTIISAKGTYTKTIVKQ